MESLSATTVTSNSMKPRNEEMGCNGHILGRSWEHPTHKCGHSDKDAIWALI